MKHVLTLSIALYLLRSAAVAGPSPTRLYVSTAPVGAVVFLDGKKIGMSDGLFVVAPGAHVVSVRLDGHAPERRRVSAKTEQITRLKIVLKPIMNPRPAPKEGEPAKAVEAFLRRGKINEKIRLSMLTVLRQHPSESRWSGQHDTALFAIVAKAMPTGDVRRRAMPAMLSLTHSLAVRELLKTKSLLNRYKQTGLTDATTLRQAVVMAAGRLHVVGRVKGMTHGAVVQDGFAVAYVTTEESNLTAHLLHQVELEKVRKAYRNIMHGQARELMKRRNWRDAVLLWRHLHTRKLVSQALYLDAGRCFSELKQYEDAVRILVEALDTFRAIATPEFLEQAGDIALGIDTSPAQELAKNAYLEASRKLLNTVSSAAEPGKEKNRTNSDSVNKASLIQKGAQR
jgi:hypothetical protein